MDRVSLFTIQQPQRVGVLEFVVRIVSSFAILVPFLVTIDALSQQLDPRSALHFANPWILISVCFGMAYSAANDLRASLIAVVLAMSMFGRLSKSSLFDNLTQLTDAKVDVLSSQLKGKTFEQAQKFARSSLVRFHVVKDRTLKDRTLKDSRDVLFVVLDDAGKIVSVSQL